MSDKTLGDYSDVGDYGAVDFFGLNEFGEPVGMNPMYGALIGTGLSTGTAIALRAFTKDVASPYHKYSEGIGFLVAGVAGGIMMASAGTRAAGMTSIASAFLSNGLRQIEKSMKPETGYGYGYGLPYIETAGPVIEQAQTLGQPGFGLVLPEEMSGVAGATLSAGPPLDISLQGNLSSSAVGQVQMVEGPEMSGLGAHYGATLYGAHQ